VTNREWDEYLDEIQKSEFIFQPLVTSFSVVVSVASVSVDH